MIMFICHCSTFHVLTIYQTNKKYNIYAVFYVGAIGTVALKYKSKTLKSWCIFKIMNMRWKGALFDKTPSKC